MVTHLHTHTLIHRQTCARCFPFLYTMTWCVYINSLFRRVGESSSRKSSHPFINTDSLLAFRFPLPCEEVWENSWDSPQSCAFESTSIPSRSWHSCHTTLLETRGRFATCSLPTLPLSLIIVSYFSPVLPILHLSTLPLPFLPFSSSLLEILMIFDPVFFLGGYGSVGNPLSSSMHQNHRLSIEYPYESRLYVG